MQTSIPHTVDHLFRHESGRMVAVLSRLLGLRHLQTAQDIVQDTLLQALTTWSYKGVPNQPSAWLYRVARNKAMDVLRREKTFQRLLPSIRYGLQSEYAVAAAVRHSFGEGEITDSVLQLMFACCHAAIPVEAQMALILKTLCGLSTAEIAKAFLTGEAAVAKRIYRAKEKIRTEGIELEMPGVSQLPRRLDAVLHSLYLLFNEGYNSSHPGVLVREDLCGEAMRLAYLLTQNPVTNLSRTNALLALFCFQASRLRSRTDEKGYIILLRHQDRSRWYRPLIRQGILLLEAAEQKESSVYHLEAAIACLHATAPCFETTNWKAIHRLYTVLYRRHPSPVIALNKAIATSYAVGKAAAIEELEGINGLHNYYLYHTAIGEIYFDWGQPAKAEHYYQKALSLTASAAEQHLLRTKIGACTTCHSA